MRLITLLALLAICGMNCVEFEDRGMAEYSDGNALSEDPSNTDDVVVVDGVEAPGSACEEMWYDEVKAYVDSKCVFCHGNPPAAAPIPLASFEDFQALSLSGVPLYVQAHGRVSKQTMPPGGGNSDAEIALMETWASLCADEAAQEEGTEAGEDGDEPDTEEELDTLDAEEDGTIESDAENNEGGEGGCEPDLNGPTWENDIQPLLEEKCGSCHGPVLSSGAPFPIVTYEDVLGPAFYNPDSDERLYDRILVRMSGQNMPPGGGNTESELALYQSWLDNCHVENDQPSEEGEGGDARSEREEDTVDGSEEESEEDSEEESEEDSGEDSVGEETSSMNWSLLFPFLEAECGGCHLEGGYAPLFTAEYGQANAYSCPNSTVAECMLIRVNDGTMPPNGDKVSVELIEAVETWIADGYLE